MQKSLVHNPGASSGAIAMASRTHQMVDILSSAVGWPDFNYRAELDFGPDKSMTLSVNTEVAVEGLLRLTGCENDVKVCIEYRSDAGSNFADETISVYLPPGSARLEKVLTGPVFPLAALDGFTIHPVPFKVGLDGIDRSIDIGSAEPAESFAEGWILENGCKGLLVMRLPDSSPQTCFVPMAIRGVGVGATLQIGSIGPDGSCHKSGNVVPATGKPGETLIFPVTRYVFFEGGWHEGVELFRSIISSRLHRLTLPYRASPVTYNTFHDFNSSYTRDALADVMPQLQQLGIGLLHLDPGWETVWGSTEWNEEVMGEPEAFIELAASFGLKVGCWTSLHTPDPSIHCGCYATDSEGFSYVAEQFGDFRLLGVCPLSCWREKFYKNLGRLVKAGFVFVNSDFHDWPWPGHSCRSTEHYHAAPLSRPEWAKALNDAFTSLRAENPNLVIEMHDHVESGEYRTPVWYLYDASGSYDEKWAYEFMWTTHQDLLDGKLASLYHVRKAEPIPLFLHINMSTDNGNALAFWYVASCVNHIGVGGVLNASKDVFQGYKKAIACYNQYFREMTEGLFVGLDELTHLHVHPGAEQALLIGFNLTDDVVHRDVKLALPKGTFPTNVSPTSNGCDVELLDGAGNLHVTIGPKDVCLVALKFPARYIA